MPRRGLAVVVVNGDDDASLNFGAGHVPGTAAIGASGNTVIAGHRDMAFRARCEMYTVLRDDGADRLTMISC